MWKYPAPCHSQLRKQRELTCLAGRTQLFSRSVARPSVRPSSLGEEQRQSDAPDLARVRSVLTLPAEVEEVHRLKRERALYDLDEPPRDEVFEGVTCHHSA